MCTCFLICFSSSSSSAANASYSQLSSLGNRAVRMVLLSNRDEWLTRPADAPLSMSFGSSLIAGRDLEKNGSWLAFSRESGAFAVLTNSQLPRGRRGRMEAALFSVCLVALLLSLAVLALFHHVEHAAAEGREVHMVFLTVATIITSLHGGEGTAGGGHDGKEGEQQQQAIAFATAVASALGLAFIVWKHRKKPSRGALPLQVVNQCKPVSTSATETASNGVDGDDTSSSSQYSGNRAGLGSHSRSGDDGDHIVTNMDGNIFSPMAPYMAELHLFDPMNMIVGSVHENAPRLAFVSNTAPAPGHGGLSTAAGGGSAAGTLIPLTVNELHGLSNGWMDDTDGWKTVDRGKKRTLDVLLRHGLRVDEKTHKVMNSSEVDVDCAMLARDLLSEVLEDAERVEPAAPSTLPRDVKTMLASVFVPPADLLAASLSRNKLLQAVGGWIHDQIARFWAIGTASRCHHHHDSPDDTSTHKEEEDEDGCTPEEAAWARRTCPPPVPTKRMHAMYGTRTSVAIVLSDDNMLYVAERDLCPVTGQRKFRQRAIHCGFGHPAAATARSMGNRSPSPTDLAPAPAPAPGPAEHADIQAAATIALRATTSEFSASGSQLHPSI